MYVYDLVFNGLFLLFFFNGGKRNQAEVFISKGGEELFDLISKEVRFSFHDYQFTLLYYLIVVYGDVIIAYVFIML